MDYKDIIHFWFVELQPTDWWKKNTALDALISRRFARIHAQACTGTLYQWRDTAEGALAEIIVLDQFSRNMFRDQAASFAQDTVALILAQEALRRDLDQLLNSQQRNFLYLPFMHSEETDIQEQSLRLFTALGDDYALDFAQRHKVIIDRFGRFPHRNAILGRTSTREEMEFLREPGSSF